MKRNSFLLALVSVFISSTTLQTAFGQSWNLSGNSIGGRTIAKLGTTNSSPLRLFTKNAERVRIDTLGYVGIGTTRPVNLFTLRLSGSVPSNLWVGTGSLPALMAFGENMSTGSNLATASDIYNHRPVINTRRSRGTLAVPTAVKNGDYLASMVSSGYDGTAFQNPATIDFYVDSTPFAGNVPARISFVTGSNGNNRLERLKVGSNGNFYFNNNQLFLRQSDKRIGIGTSDPAANLHVIGTSLFAGMLKVSDGGLEATTEILEGRAVYGLAIGPYGTGLQGKGYYGVYADGSFVGVRGNGNAAGIVGVTPGEDDDFGPLPAGVYGATDGVGNGVQGYAKNGNGIYGSVGTGYAGFFAGKVYSTISFTASDKNLKQNISEFKSALAIISSLKPKIYEFRHDGNYKLMNLPAGKHYGLLAQDLQEILPDLVNDVTFDIRMAHTDRLLPRDSRKEGAATPEQRQNAIDFKAVNYTELIPVIIKAMQEQQLRFEEESAEMNAEIADLKKQVNDLKILFTSSNKQSTVTPSKAYLKQNTPNPTNNIADIFYHIPKDAGKAQITITDSKGSTVKVYKVKPGDGSLNITGGSLPVGVYNYTLYINNKSIDSKQLVIAK